MPRVALISLFLVAGIGWAADVPILAYSLNEAQRILQEGSQATADVDKLGGATRLLGLIYDREHQDVVVICRAEQGREALDLSNLVVALRALNVLKEWPLVSIDPTPDTPVTKKQVVRFEGGIAGSRFSQALLESDVALKGMGIGTLEVKGLGLPSYFDLRASLAKNRAVAAEGHSRLWFYAVDPLLEQREDVFAIRELKVGVRTQIVGDGASPDGQPRRDEAAERFSRILTDSYDQISQRVPEVARLRGLFEMVALAEGIQSMPDADLSYWLNDYSVPQIETPKEFGYVVRQELIRTVDGIRLLEIGGGIQLKVLAMRLEDGDITALRDAVLLSRPAQGALTWKVPLDEWALSDHPSTPTMSSKLSDPDAGSSLSWRFVHQGESPADQGKPLYDPSPKSGSNSQLGDAFRFVDPKDLTIVDPPTDSRYVIELPGKAKSASNGVPKAAAPSDIKSLISELEKGISQRIPNLAEMPPVTEKPTGMYHTGADGLNYLNENSLEKLQSGSYHTGTDGLNYLNGSSLEKGQGGSYHVGADGLNYRNENSIERPQSTNTGTRDSAGGANIQQSA